MRRLLIIALAMRLLCPPGQIATLHVHQYDPHAHPEHHHGPAAHAHHGAASSDDTSLTGCDPGDHVIAVSGTVAAASHPELLGTEPTHSLLPVEVSRPERAVSIVDARVHGPPRDPSLPFAGPLP